MNSVFKNPLVKVLPYVLGFWVLAFIIEACVSKADDLSSKTVAKKPTVVYTPVDGVVVQPGKVSEEFEVTGTLVANQQVDIVSELTRKIIRVNVKEGSKVKKGTLLFQLDDADLQAQLELSSAREVSFVK